MDTVHFIIKMFIFIFIFIFNRFGKRGSELTEQNEVDEDTDYMD